MGGINLKLSLFGSLSCCMAVKDWFFTIKNMLLRFGLKFRKIPKLHNVIKLHDRKILSVVPYFKL